MPADWQMGFNSAFKVSSLYSLLKVHIDRGLHSRMDKWMEKK